MEYRLGTDNRIKARGETMELTCPQCGKKGHFGVFSNFERRIAILSAAVCAVFIVGKQSH